MNDSQSSSTPESDIDSPNLDRLHAIWRNIKEKRQSIQERVGKSKYKPLHRSRGENQVEQISQKHVNKHLNSIEREANDDSNLIESSRHFGQSMGSVREVKKAIISEEQKTFQARLRLTERQLANARQNTALLMKKLSEAQQIIENLTFYFEHEAKKNIENEAVIAQLTSELEKSKTNQGKPNLNISESHQYEKQAKQLKKRLQMKDKEIDRLTLKIKSMEVERKSYDFQMKTLKETADSFQRKLSDAEKAMNEMYMGGDQSKGAQLLELEQANNTIERLSLLLKSTSQYRKSKKIPNNFLQLHFLKNIPRRIKEGQVEKKFPKFCSCMEINLDERSLWTPTACYKILLAMKVKHSQLTQMCIQESLFELNQIWLARQSLSIFRVRESYEFEIAKLKKKNEQRYDELVARKQIQRLKKELTVAKYSKKTSMNEHESLEQLKNFGQYEDEVRLKTRQIKLLQERIKLMESDNSSYDKVLYLEGSLWMIEKVLEQMEHSQYDLKELESKFTQSNQAETFKYVFQTIEEINSNLLEKLHLMKTSILKKMGNSRSRVRNNLNSQLQ